MYHRWRGQGCNRTIPENAWRPSGARHLGRDSWLLCVLWTLCRTCVQNC